MRIAEAYWNASRRHLGTEDEVWQRLADIIEDGEAVPGGYPRPTSDDLEELAFLSLWAHEAYPKIVTNHTYAAALMCSSGKPDLANDLALPWRAFVVAVPDGLLPIRGTQVTRVRVGIYRGLRGGDLLFLEAFNPAEVNGFRVTAVGTSVEILFAPERAPHPGGDQDVERVMSLCRRLVCGLLVAMQFKENFRTREVLSKARGGGREGPPSHRVVVVGRPLKLDVRSEVQRYLAGDRGGVPSVQSLVRGHYKRQVVGTHGSDRKVVWIQPYWRGPEDAPILARPYAVR